MGKTIAQKIFDSHLVESPFPGTYVLKLDRVFCHEITTPVAIQDLVERGKDRVFDPTKIKAVIDHVTPAKDSKTATQGKILRDWAKRNNGVIKEYDRDKYLFFFHTVSLKEMEEEKFDILDRIRDIRVGDGKLPVTVSIGVAGIHGEFSEKERAAAAALDMATPIPRRPS